jgi:fructose transport system permease protein
MASTTVAAPEELGNQSPSALERVQRELHNHPTLGAFTVLVLSALAFEIINTRFLALENISIMFQQVAVIGTLALAQTIIILTAGIDLSVGAAMILVQYLMAEFVVKDSFVGLLALLIGLLLAAGTGLVNGILVSRIRLPPFIVTLGTLSVFTSLGLIISNGGALTVSPHNLLNWTGKFVNIGSFTITTGVLLMLACYVVVGFVMSRTAWGRHVYALGDDSDAARLAGIRTRRTLLGVYVLAGVIVGVAAWIQIGRVGGASTDISSTLNLDSITAVVIGGTSLFGGRGTALGTLFGALIVEIFQNGLVLANVQDNYQQLAEGLLVLLAVAVDQWIRRAR